MNIALGQYNTLTVSRKVDFGFYLDDAKEGILLPKRFAPADLKIGDSLKVFVYHDSDNRLIATTQQPKGMVGDIVALKCVSATGSGAFLDWGLMKDLFVAKSQQIVGMRTGGTYLVKIYIDEQSNRIAASEKIDHFLSNEILAITEKEIVHLIAYRKTDIGYSMIINQQHLGLLHDNEVFKDLEIGKTYEGYIKNILPDHKIDVALGKPGFQKVADESAHILQLLQQNKGFLPYHDKSAPEDIYSVFGMSKKTFKMVVGTLYKQKKINLTGKGIELIH
ncbi:S1-like domain-containing RNA-binding protein [Hydrotalea sp.]|uniref:CvfB family protein n=1 Tax=Hydrotalea sp. TaxID=2881279 RepID=UPI002614FCA2|nr:S1-like domain-containing RNA-binding protein [Hydrotalea sp.]